MKTFFLNLFFSTKASTLHSTSRVIMHKLQYEKNFKWYELKHKSKVNGLQALAKIVASLFCVTFV